MVNPPKLQRYYEILFETLSPYRMVHGIRDGGGGVPGHHDIYYDPPEDRWWHRFCPRGRQVVARITCEPKQIEGMIRDRNDRSWISCYEGMRIEVLEEKQRGTLEQIADELSHALGEPVVVEPWREQRD